MNRRSFLGALGLSPIAVAAAAAAPQSNPRTIDAETARKLAREMHVTVNVTGAADTATIANIQRMLDRRDRALVRRVRG